MSWVQDIANQGLYHPSVNLSIAARVIVNYTPQDYPTDAQRSNGFICGCTNYYNNPCRAEFRKVPEIDLSLPLNPLQCFWLCMFSRTYSASSLEPLGTYVRSYLP